MKLAPAKSGTPQVKSALAPAKPGTVAVKPVLPSVERATGAAGTRHAVAGEERRRSQRVLLRVRANVHVALQGKASTFEVTTLSVNSHGALIVVPRSLPLETSVVLEHTVSRQRVACKIVRPAREMPEGFHIALEFDSPEPNFWGIAFPPADWRPPDDL
ncbi:MAG: PilZ domain-containing protein [Candidatus Acidiferrales bacterium]